MNLIADILKNKGNVLTMNGEFAVSIVTWRNKGYTIDYVIPEKLEYPVSLIEKSINKDIKILVSSHVQYSTGYMQDLEELGNLCKKHCLINVVNATQSICAMPIDVKKDKIDFLTCSTYKWGLSGFGIGILYINKEFLKNFIPPMAGSLNVEGSLAGDFQDLKYVQGAKSIEISTPHFPNIFALGAAVDMINEIGIPAIQERIYELQEYLRSQLEENGIQSHHFSNPKHRSGILLLKLEKPKEVQEYLTKKNYFVSGRMDGLRLTTHIYNSEKQIDQLVVDIVQAVESTR
jgi:selenocysteine lyase/cysteine desulfurase